MIINLFLFFVFFPYISIYQTGTDLQPYALLLSLIYNVLFLRKLKVQLSLFLVCPAISLLFLIFTNFNFEVVRAIASYLSLFSITAASYSIFNSTAENHLVKKYFVVATYIWLITAIIEIFWYPEFMKILIPNINLDNDRGVVGMATEPSFYGIYCFFLLFLNYLINNNSKIIMIILLIQIIILAQSTMAILLLVVVFMYWALFNISIKNVTIIIIIIAIISCFIFYVFPGFEDYRVIYLLSNLVNDPLGLIKSDTSLNARGSHIIFSVLGFFDNYGIPHGFGNFGDYVEGKIIGVNYIWLGKIYSNMKIMSGYGSAFYELGVFAFSVPIAVFIIFNNYFQSKKNLFIATLSFNTVMFSAIQISLPILGLIIGCMLFKSNSMTRNISN